MLLSAAEAVQLLSSAAELRLHTAEFVNAFSSMARAAHVQAKRDGMRHAMHAACVQCAARQAVCARRVGTNRGMAKKETIRLHDRARERAAKVCGRGSLARGWIAFLAFLSVCFVGLKPLRFGAPPPSVSACQLLNKHAIKAAPVSNGF